ncbi:MULTISPECIES: LysR family transcriptional regulator [Novosphingobium]|uniref:LysR family transcriptional regulator n=1 Tax=Novosphingobium subterraneum TaxID=48936 RepID=A0A0B8ZIB5_9SPHN|nr:MULTISPECIES: LysR family transcriptional regulator [Novosphingobium]KHS46022.1 LysR family transcriptional regulator [Novosphingobium subterraneum]QOV95783.1 LysR family transcriptional regulator [Novosphingobium sp. ES2-1]
MDLRQLRYFNALAETLNFHRAAERLHISQPPLTVAIRKLEEDLGVALFERDPRGVRLTTAGLAAVAPAREALAAAEKVREAVRQGAAGLRGRLSIGFIGSAIGELLPRIVSPFRHAYPEVELALEEMNSVEIVRAIAARRLDVGLVRLPVMDSAPVAIDVIETDELVAVLPASDVLARRKTLDLGALADRSFIIYSPVSVLHATIRLACHRAGFTPRVAQEAVQVQTILSLVEAGLGVALIPGRSARFAGEGVRIVTLSDPVPIAMGIARADEPSVLARNFVRTALACENA